MARTGCPLTFLARVEKEERENNRQQDNLPKSEHSSIETAGLVMGIHVNDERAETDSDHQPDDLSLGVPHNESLAWRQFLMS